MLCHYVTESNMVRFMQQTQAVSLNHVTQTIILHFTSSKIDSHPFFHIKDTQITYKWLRGYQMG